MRVPKESSDETYDTSCLPDACTLAESSAGVRAAIAKFSMSATDEIKKNEHHIRLPGGGKRHFD
jgi:hypothetical protein